MNFSDRNISDQELDNLFRKANANEAAPPKFEVSFFDEIAAQLPVKEKKRRLVAYWWTIPSAAAILGLIYGLNLRNSFQFEYSIPEIQTHQTNKTTAKLLDKNSLNTSSNEVRNLLIPNEKVQEKNDLKVLVKSESPFKNNFENNSKNPEKGSGSGSVSCGGSNSRSQTKIDRLVAKSLVENSINQAQIPSTKIKAPFILGTGLYIQGVALIGQSPRKDVASNSNLNFGFSFSGGMKRQSKNTAIELGIAYRYEHLNNAIWKDQISKIDPQTGISSLYFREIKVTNIHSLDFPIVFSFEKLRSSFGIIASPGIQLQFSGEETVFVNQEEIRTPKTLSPSTISSTLTMELGFQYLYNLNERYSLYSSLRTDVLRPFNQANFTGNNTLLPLNLQVGIRYRL